MVPLESSQFLKGITSAADAHSRARRHPGAGLHSNPGARLLRCAFPASLEVRPGHPGRAFAAIAAHPCLARSVGRSSTGASPYPLRPTELRALNRSAVVPHVAGDWTRHDFYAGDLILVISRLERVGKNTRRNKQRPSRDLRGCFFKVNIRLY